MGQIKLISVGLVGATLVAIWCAIATLTWLHRPRAQDVEKQEHTDLDGARRAGL